MRRLLVPALLLGPLGLTGCGEDAPAVPTGPAPLTARVVAAEAAHTLAADPPARGRGPRPGDRTWWAELTVRPETRVEVLVRADGTAKRRFTPCAERLRDRRVTYCEPREGYGAPVLVLAREDAASFAWTVTALAGPRLLRTVTMTITGPGDRTMWLQGEDLPGANVDQLIAIALDPDLAPRSSAAAAHRAEELTGFTPAG